MRAAPSLFFVLLIFILAALAQGQQFDLLIKNGHVIDPKNNRDSVIDVAVADGKIAQIDRNIPADRARTVVNAQGLYVTPGLLDIHVHVFYGTEADADYSNSYLAVAPDGHTFRSGVTTVVDVGGAGWRNFPQFKQQVIDRSQTRVLAFLNIVGSGMKGGPIEQNLDDMDPKLTAHRIRQYPDILVGVKVAHYEGPEWEPVDRAVRAGQMADVPVMVDFGRSQPPLPLKDLLLVHLRPGDILTHTYAHVTGREPVVGKDGTVHAYVFEAQRRGVIFDVGHGAGSFVFRQAVPAMKQGFLPNSISTDLHRNSMLGGMKTMANVMSKFLNMGLSIQDVIVRSTWNPARQIKRADLGHLDVGAGADIAVFSLKEGNFGFIDVEGRRMSGTKKLECELTVRDGRVAWDLNGLASPPWDEAGE